MIKHRVRRVVGKTSRLVRRSPLGVETITQRGASGPRPVFTDLPMRGRSWGGGGGEVERDGLEMIIGSEWGSRGCDGRRQAMFGL